MRLRQIAAALTLLALVVVCLTDSSARTKSRRHRPNILLILLDDLRFDSFGGVGQSFSETPNIDRLATEGVAFTRSFVVHSLCSPSRVSLMTGRYPHVHGILDNSTRLRTELPTVQQLLQGVGYETGFVGKWHVGNGRGEPELHFDYWAALYGTDPTALYVDPLVNVGGTVQATAGHVTNVLTDFAQQFIEKPRRRGQPFFLMLSHLAVHSPLTSPPRYETIYTTEPVTLPTTLDEPIDTKPSFVQGSDLWWLTDPGAIERRIRRYHRVVRGVDDGVGLLLDQLESSGLLKNTLVILTGDNGLLMGEHGLRGKILAYEESIRVPLIVRYPRWFRGGQDVSELALNVDIAPTLLEAARVSLPETEGVSLRSLVRGQVQRDAFLYQSFDIPGSPLFPFPGTIRAIRTHTHKLVTYPDSDDPDELYDLVADPLETTNVAGDPTHVALADSLRIRLAELRAQLGDTD